MKQLRRAIAWMRFVATPNVFPSRWQDRLFRGHVTIHLGGTTRVVIYGANAMHWAVNVAWRGEWWCFHPRTRTFGGQWPAYFYVSPDATPC
jgi:hypothetical protein